MNLKSNDLDGVVYLTSQDVLRRYGNRSHMWLVRRLADDKDTFPKPTKMGRLKFWKLSELEAWEKRCAAQPRQYHVPTPTSMKGDAKRAHRSATASARA